MRGRCATWNRSEKRVRMADCYQRKLALPACESMIERRFRSVNLGVDRITKMYKIWSCKPAGEFLVALVNRGQVECGISFFNFPELWQRRNKSRLKIQT